MRVDFFVCVFFGGWGVFMFDLGNGLVIELSDPSP